MRHEKPKDRIKRYQDLAKVTAAFLEHFRRARKLEELTVEAIQIERALGGLR